MGLININIIIFGVGGQSQFTCWWRGGGTWTYTCMGLGTRTLSPSLSVLCLLSPSALCLACFFIDYNLIRFSNSITSCFFVGVLESWLEDFAGVSFFILRNTIVHRGMGGAEHHNNERRIQKKGTCRSTTASRSLQEPLPRQALTLKFAKLMNF